MTFQEYGQTLLVLSLYRVGLFVRYNDEFIVIVILLSSLTLIEKIRKCHIPNNKTSSLAVSQISARHLLFEIFI
jgi:hypothetical protein